MMVKKEVMALKWEIEQEKEDQAHETEMLTLNRQKEKIEAEVDIALYRLMKEEEKFRAVTTKLDHQVQPPASRSRSDERSKSSIRGGASIR
jgi:hypothetical protein